MKEGGSGKGERRKRVREKGRARETAEWMIGFQL